MATTTYGRIKEFEAHSEDWETYVERVEMFFDTNGIENDTRCHLIVVCGHKNVRTAEIPYSTYKAK